MITQGIKYGILLTGLLLITCGEVVLSKPIGECYNDTDGSLCFIADDIRSSRLLEWTAAWNYCTTLNSTLPIIKSRQMQFHLSEFLLKNNFTLDSVWLGGCGVSTGWKWVYNERSFNVGSLEHLMSSSPNVAAIGEQLDGNVTESAILLYSLSSSTQGSGYICQFKDSRPCSGNADGATYYPNGASCFVRYLESIGWILARNKCVMLGGDLATLTDTSEEGVKMVLDGVRATGGSDQASNKWKPYWVGLRNISWEWNTDKSEIEDVYSRDGAALDYPDDASKNCLAVDYKQQFAWSFRDYTVKLQTICQSGAYTPIPSPAQSPGETQTPTVSLPVWAVGLICGLAGLIYIVSLIVVGIICCKCCGSKNSKQSDDNEGGLRQRNSYTPGPKVVNTLPPPPSRMPRANEEDNGEYEYPDDEFDDDYVVPSDQRRPAGTEYANHAQVGRPPGRGKPR